MLEIICLLIFAGTILGWKWMSDRCHHQWEIVKTVHVDTDGICDYDRVYLRCVKCGEMKCKTMK